MKSEKRGVVYLNINSLGNNIRSCPHTNAEWDVLVAANPKMSTLSTAASCADPVAPMSYMMGFTEPYVTEIGGVWTATNWQPTHCEASSIDLPSGLSESYKTLFETQRATVQDSMPRFGVEEK